MSLTTVERLMEPLSLALEQRSSGWQDLVSNSNVILHMMQNNDMWQPYSGPIIRERLVYTQTGTHVRYKGPDFLSPTTQEVVNDAEFDPKMAAVSVVVTSEELLKNDGENQIIDVLSLHIEVAEGELKDRFVEDLHSAGSLSNQIGGLQKAIPTDPTTGTYGGISRADNAIWRTNVFDAQSDFSSVTSETAFNATSAYDMMLKICIDTSRYNDGPDCFVMSPQHYQAYSASLNNIQRIQKEGGAGGQGFTSLKFYGAGKSMDCYLEGGIGTAMPSNISYVMHKKALRFRYHPKRNFKKFGGKQMPINQDMVVQHIGIMGELTLINPIHMSKLHDSA
ncbi:MAG: phage major capsid protein [Pseudomonadota bacterium]